MINPNRYWNKNLIKTKTKKKNNDKIFQIKL